MSVYFAASGLGMGVLLLVACGAPEKSPQASAGSSGMSGAAQAGDAGSASGGASSGTGGGGVANPSGGASGQAGQPGQAGQAGQGPVSLSPPVDCSKLSTTVGVWENISPPALLDPVNMEVYSVAVSPLDGTVFMAGGNNTNGGACPQGSACPQTLTGMMRSSDCGATFTRINTIEPGTAGANLITGALWAMVLDPQDPNVMYVANGYGMDPTIYKSTNAGVDWTEIVADPNGKLMFVQAIAVDPHDSQHVALTWHVNCEPPRRPFCLSKSNDGGESWMLFDGPASIPGWEIGGWMEASAISILGSTSYLLQTPAGIWFSGDTGESWAQVAPETVYGSYSGSTVIAGGDLFIAGAGHIWKSPAALGSDPPFELGSLHTATQLPNSPEVTAIVTDGKKLYAGSSRDGEHQLWSAPLSDPSSWTQTTDQICQGTRCRGPNAMAYDPVHHVVYAANWGTGLWRLVTE